MSPRIVTLLSDFGSADAYAGIMKGVILGICPEVHIVDLTHEVKPQDVTAGALLLRSAARYFPAGTIHLAVVDPGVGGNRAAVLVQTPTACFIGPDNGLLYPAAQGLGVQRIIALTRPEYHLRWVSRTFHGRDVFAPVAGHVARGVVPEAFGPPLSSMQPLTLPVASVGEGSVRGEVVHVDRFGNLVTNVTRTDIAGFGAAALSVSIATHEGIPLAGTYSEARAGEMVALIGSWEHLEIAVREGNAAQTLGVGVGTAVRVRVF